MIQMLKNILFSSFFFLFTNYLCAEFVINTIQTEKKEIVLTIDDGPHPTTTPKILAILKKQNVNATFFLVASKVKQYPHLAKKIITEGHSIGNHTYLHDKISTISNEELLNDIALSQIIFYENINQLPIYFRPPYGKLSQQNIQFLKSHFKHVVKWSIDPQEWRKEKSSKEVTSHVLDHLKPGRIILLHESKKTIQLLPRLIRKIKKVGYSFTDIKKKKLFTSKS